MAYVVQNGRECLLGRQDGEALGIIVLDSQGSLPTESTSQKVSTQRRKDSSRKHNGRFPGCSLPHLQKEEEDVSRLETLDKPNRLTVSSEG